MTRKKPLIAAVGVLGASAALAAPPVFAADPARSHVDPGGRFYAGLFAGYKSYSYNWIDGIVDDFDGDLSEIGGLVGWRIYDRHLLFAVEGDLAVATDPGLVNGPWAEFRGSGHLRGLFGYVHGDLSVFGAVGLAIALTEYDGLSDPEDVTLVGASLGAGVEYKVHERFRLRVEGLYDSYPRVDFNDGYNGKWSDTTIRAGAIFDLN